MSNIVKEQGIKYLNKDFQGLKRDLMEYTKAHMSGVFQDYNETSPGMAMLETWAYVGDILSWYLDAQFNELKLVTAQQTTNVMDIAKMLGYRPQGPRAASTMETFFVAVPAELSGGVYVPQLKLTPALLAGAQVTGPNGATFETLENVDFSVAPRDLAVAERDPVNGQPKTFAVRKNVQVVAGKTYTDTFSLSDFQQFLRLELAQPDVLELLRVEDSDGNEWFQVDFLSQDAVIEPLANVDSDKDTVPYVIHWITVPRRFQVDNNIATGKTSIQFGSGDGMKFDDQLVPNVAELALPIPGRGTLTNFTLDPQNFLKTSTLGLSPYNTTLSVTYRAGGGSDTNVPAGSINNVAASQMQFREILTGSAAQAANSVISSLECLNLSASSGGAPAETVSEIKANASAYFAAQGRAVTREDYMAHVFSMPAKFGKVEKAYISRDSIDPNTIDIHVLSKNGLGQLEQPTNSLSNNIKNWLKKLRMLTDAVNIMGTDIVNISVKFGVVISPKKNRQEVLTNCLAALKNYFDIDNMQIGQPIVASDVKATLQAIDGVVSVYNVNFTNRFHTSIGGQQYSEVRWDINGHTHDEILYPPPNAIFEVRYPNIDIEGESK
jgi:hypothetical protein